MSTIKSKKSLKNKTVKKQKSKNSYYVAIPSYHRSDILEKKTRKTLKRNNKTLRIYNAKKYKKQYIQKGGYVMNENELVGKKQALENSFELLNPIYEKKNIKVYVGRLVGLLYSNSITYDYFHNFYDKLVKYDIITCDDCSESSFTTPYTKSGLYKIFKIYFVIGFIISYYYKHLTKFIDEEYLKNLTGLDSNILYFKEFITNLTCNPFIEVSTKYCIIISNIEQFIRENEFNVNENPKITKIIFDFILDIPIIRNMDRIKKFVDPKLYPENVEE